MEKENEEEEEWEEEGLSLICQTKQLGHCEIKEVIKNIVRLIKESTDQRYKNS